MASMGTCVRDRMVWPFCFFSFLQCAMIKQCQTNRAAENPAPCADSSRQLMFRGGRKVAQFPDTESATTKALLELTWMKAIYPEREIRLFILKDPRGEIS